MRLNKINKISDNKFRKGGLIIMTRIKSKITFLMSVMLIVLLGFSSMDARGQAPVVCPGDPAFQDTTGLIELQLLSGSADFNAGVLGTLEGFLGGFNAAGMDWVFSDAPAVADAGGSGAFFRGTNPWPTNLIGSQLINPFSQANGRSTYIQVTNFDESNFTTNGTTPVHVVVYDTSCMEVINFCDFYTIDDTHIYDLGNLVANSGQDIDENQIQGIEGIFTVTAINGPDCTVAEQDRAVEHNDGLAGTFFILDPADTMYGVNSYARQAICTTQTVFNDDVELVTNGMFDNVLAPWTVEEGRAEIGTADLTVPPVSPPSQPTQLGMLSQEGSGGGTYSGGSTGVCGVSSVGRIPNCTFPLDSFNGASDFTPYEDCTTVEQNISLIGQDGDFTDLSFDYLYGYQNTGNSSFFAALIFNNSSQIQDAFCLQPPGSLQGGFTTFFGNVSCDISPPGDMLIDRTITIMGLSSMAERATTYNSQDGNEVPDTEWVQFILCTANQQGDEESYALVDNVSKIDDQDELIGTCNGILTGEPFSRFALIQPDTLWPEFNVQSTLAGSDLILLAFNDDYGAPYRLSAATVAYRPFIIDSAEQNQSCAILNHTCYVRVGVNSAVPNSDDFQPIQPSPTPTPTPTGSPSPSPTPTPTPTPTSTRTGDGNGCGNTLAGPVQAGSAMANVLIPLIPVAFAFGVRALRRRKK